MQPTIRPATAAAAPLTAAMAVALNTEIPAVVGIRVFDLDVDRSARLCSPARIAS
jgi:hypothetical protein